MIFIVLQHNLEKKRLLYIMRKQDISHLTNMVFNLDYNCVASSSIVYHLCVRVVELSFIYSSFYRCVVGG